MPEKKNKLTYKAASKTTSIHSFMIFYCSHLHPGVTGAIHSSHRGRCLSPGHTETTTHQFNYATCQLRTTQKCLQVCGYFVAHNMVDCHMYGDRALALLYLPPTCLFHSFYPCKILQRENKNAFQGQKVQVLH